MVSFLPSFEFSAVLANLAPHSLIAGQVVECKTDLKFQKLLG